MTDSQLLVLAGMIWVAPHCPPLVGLFGGSLIIIAASLKGLAWV